MNYSVEELIKIATKISESREINIIDIPCVDLYMDQVTTLFEDKLSHLKRSKDETILTKTMINNYAKAKILSPIKNKKYTKKQIMLLLLVYNLKQIMSLDDIKLLITPLINQSTSSSNHLASLDKLYDGFLNIKKNQSDKFVDNLRENIEVIKNIDSVNIDGSKDLHELILQVLTLINSANLQKRMAENIIDSYFKNAEKKEP